MQSTETRSIQYLDKAKNNMKEEIVIIGAGLVGSLLGIYLVKEGYKVSIYEGRADRRLEGVAAGRSINLALSDRGIKALEKVGVMKEVQDICIPMHSRGIHLADGKYIEQAYGTKGQFINSVSRGELNNILMNIAERSGVQFVFEHRCKKIDWDTNTIHFSTSSNKIVEKKTDLIFGADGAFSASRLSYQLKHDRFDYNQFFISHGYKELTIPAGENGSFLIEKNVLHIWPRGNYMLIALPNMDGSFTCTLFFPYEGANSFASLETPEKVKAFFQKEFTDVEKIMPTLTEDFFNNPTASLVTVKCFPWVLEDKFALIGDAAHAMVPFFGQGMNCGFEDCAVLHDVMQTHKGDWKKILAEYQTLRKPDGDAISDLALANFVEMRDKVADTKFIAQKKLEAQFHAKHPEKWIPAYSMVTFSPEMRYSTALQKGIEQQRIMDKVMGDKEMDVLSAEMEAAILKELAD